MRPRIVTNMPSNSANLHVRSHGLSYRVAKVTRESEVLACLAPQNVTIINDVTWYEQQQGVLLQPKQNYRTVNKQCSVFTSRKSNR